MMAKNDNLREGMEVYGAGDRSLGTIERIDDGGFVVAGQRYTAAAVARIAQNRVYLRGNGGEQETATADTRLASGQAADTIRVPVAEERLRVGTRDVDLGEATIRKTVVEEERTVPVTLTYEEVQIEERTVTERPATGEMLFREETIRVPLRGQEAVVTKEAVVTGEVVIEKDAVAEERQITDTVRKQRVDVEEAYREARGDFEREYTSRAAESGRTFEQAEPNYRTGFTSAHDERYEGREFEDAEPELRRTYETTSTGGDTWEQLRQDIRAGWEKARGR